MLKKIAFSLSACIATTALAGTMGSSDGYMSFQGPYLGVAIAADVFSYHTDAFKTGLLVSSADNSTLIGALGQLNFGYDYAINNQWVVGGEILANLTNISSENRSINRDSTLPLIANTNIKLTDTYDYGFDAKLGYSWDNNLIYGLAGMTFSNFKLEQGNLITFGTSTVGQNQATTKFAGGYTIGGGMEQALTTHLRLREQFNYIWYPETNYYYDNTMIINQITPSSLRRVNVSLGLAYQA